MATTRSVLFRNSMTDGGHGTFSAAVESTSMHQTTAESLSGTVPFPAIGNANNVFALNAQDIDDMLGSAFPLNTTHELELGVCPVPSIASSVQPSCDVVPNDTVHEMTHTGDQLQMTDETPDSCIRQDPTTFHRLPVIYTIVPNHRIDTSDDDSSSVVDELCNDVWDGTHVTPADLTKTFDFDAQWRFDLPQYFVGRKITCHDHTKASRRRRHTVSFVHALDHTLHLSISVSHGVIKIFKKVPDHRKKTSIATFRMKKSSILQYVKHSSGQKMRDRTSSETDSVVFEFCDAMICLLPGRIDQVKLDTLSSNGEWEEFIMNSLFKAPISIVSDAMTRIVFSQPIEDLLEALTAHKQSLLKLNPLKTSAGVPIDRETPENILKLLPRSAKVLHPIKVRLFSSGQMEPVSSSMSMISHFRELNGLFWKNTFLLLNGLPVAEQGRITTLDSREWCVTTQRLVEVGRLILHCLVNGYACRGLSSLIIYVLLLRYIPETPTKEVDVTRLVGDIPDDIVHKAVTERDPVKMQALEVYIEKGGYDHSFMGEYAESNMDDPSVRRRCVFRMLRMDLCGGRLNGLLALRVGFRFTVNCLMPNVNLFPCSALAEILKVEDMSYADLKTKLKYVDASNELKDKFDQVLVEWDGMRMLYQFWRLVTGDKSVFHVNELRITFHESRDVLICKIQSCFNSILIGPQLYEKSVDEIVDFFEAHVFHQTHRFEYD